VFQVFAPQINIKDNPTEPIFIDIALAAKT